MNVLDILEGDALEGLRRDFLRHGEDGLELPVFVKVVMETLLQSEKLPAELRDKDRLVHALCDMFEEIDRNGNGCVEWSELTGYFVEAGFAATRRFVEPLRFKYAEDISFRDTCSRGGKINRLKMLPGWGKVASFEKESMTLKIYDDKLRLHGLVRVGEASLRHGRKAEFRRKDEVSNCLVVKNLLVVVSSDLGVTFWDIHTLGFKRYAFSKAPQTCLAFSKITGKLYTGGNSPKLQVWLPEKGVRLDFISTNHKEPVTGILVIESHDVIVTCSLDKTIQLFDLATHKWKATLMGHEHGVKHMTFSEQQNTLLSAGVETDAYGWDLSSRRQVVRLVGHRFCIIGIELLPSPVQNKADRVLTGDQSGTFRIWDFQRSHSGLGVCLQIFQRRIRSFHGKSKEKEKALALKGQKQWSIDDFQPNSFCVLEDSLDLVAASSKMIRFASTQALSAGAAPTGAIFNSTALSFLTVTGSDLLQWRGKDGAVVEELYGIADSEITAVALDDRERKILIGTASGLVHVHSYSNGVRMKTTEREHSADVTCLAYVGREKILISVARDQRMVISDEWPEEEEASLLRCGSSIHKADVNCVTYSDAFGLVATGSADTKVHLWNFEFLKLELVIRSHNADVLGVSFVGAFPIVVSADSSGLVAFTLIRPTAKLKAGHCLHRWENWNTMSKVGGGFYHSGTADQMVKTSITSFAVHQQTSTGRWYFVCGDEMGVIKCLDFSDLLQSFELEQVPLSQFPFNRTGYNARRRLERDFAFAFADDMDEEGDLVSSANPELDQALRLDCCIKAHAGGVLSTQVIDEPPAVLSASLDGRICIHSRETGDLLGTLKQQTAEDESSFADGGKHSAARDWKFDVTPAQQRLETLKDQRVAEVFQALSTQEKKTKRGLAVSPEASSGVGVKHARKTDKATTSTPKGRKFTARPSTAHGRLQPLTPGSQSAKSLRGQRTGSTFSLLSSFSSNSEPIDPRAAKAHLRSNLLEQLMSTPGANQGSPSGPNSSKEDQYLYFAQEVHRHQPSDKFARTDFCASNFLRRQLGLGGYARMRERKAEKMQALTGFKRKYGSSADLVVRDAEPASSESFECSAQVKEGDANQDNESFPDSKPLDSRPQTATVPSWHDRNREFVKNVESLLLDPLPSSNDQESHSRQEDHPSPQTPGASARQDQVAHEKHTRRATVLLQKFEELERADEEDDQHIDTETADIPPELRCKWPSTPASRRSTVSRSTAGSSKRRLSLIQRQSQVTFSARNGRISTKRRTTRKSVVHRESNYGRRFGAYHETKVIELYELFKRFDPDQSGAIDVTEFQESADFKDSAILSSLGSIFESLDEDENSAIDLNEFLGCFCPVATKEEINDMIVFLHARDKGEVVGEAAVEKKKEVSAQALEEITALFAQLDVNNDGMIQLDELRALLTSLNGIISENDLEKIVRQVAANDQLELAIDDFVEVLRDYFSYESGDVFVKEILSFNSPVRRRSRESRKGTMMPAPP